MKMSVGFYENAENFLGRRTNDKRQTFIIANRRKTITIKLRVFIQSSNLKSFNILQLQELLHFKN